MRPVTKGNPPNYIYYTVAAEQNNNETFATNSSTAVVYNPAVGAVVGPAVTFTVEEVMDELYDKAVPPPAPFPNPVTLRACTRAVKAMRERLEDIYRTAKPDLALVIGDFCSFCEMPVAATLLSVEHRAPKSLYPTYTVRWQNFLLACRDCNSCKGNQPSRASAIAWAIAAGHAVPTEPQVVEAISDHYFWPDLDANTYRAIRRGYYYNTNAVAVQMTAVDARSFDNVIVAYTLDIVRANVRSGGAMRNNRQVEVQIDNNGGATGTATILLTGLNWQDNARSALRTRAWLLICANLANLYATCALIPGMVNRRNVFNGLWNAILYLAVQSGYYSVWVDITRGMAFPPGMNVVGLRANLGAQFIYDTNPANNGTIGQTFLGTNVAQVP